MQVEFSQWVVYVKGPDGRDVKVKAKGTAADALNKAMQKYPKDKGYGAYRAQRVGQ